MMQLDHTLTPYLRLLMQSSHLTREQTHAAMGIILEGADVEQSVAFLTVLKYRGETAEEIVGMIEALKEQALQVHLPYPVMDIVGTGGDGAGTVNISTGSAILAAACGIPIAKHGGRSVSSRSGSADVLEALGIDIHTPPHLLTEMLQAVGIIFMFAPTYHPSFKKVSALRQKLKIPTAFNLLGPLLNPAQADYALIGVAHQPTLKKISKVLLHLDDKKRSLVFHGNGLDELTTLGNTTAYEVYEGSITPHEIDPAHYGFAQGCLEDLVGGDAQKNAQILKDVFAGKSGTLADTLILNAGTALWIFGETPNIGTGIEIAREALQNGKAEQVLRRWATISCTFGPRESSRG